MPVKMPQVLAYLFLLPICSLEYIGYSSEQTWDQTSKEDVGPRDGIAVQRAPNGLVYLGGQHTQQNFIETMFKMDNGGVGNCYMANKKIEGLWRCTDGQNIKCSKLCNGRVDCADGSDETNFSCRMVFCSDSAFRCAHGGCIHAEKECDGVKDCVDGSDEKSLNCPGVLSSLTSQGNCSNGFFQCKSQECVYDDVVCDGSPDCQDSSDETHFLCSTHYCPKDLGHKCDYGACILNLNVCNGEMDCMDGSDENPDLC